MKECSTCGVTQSIDQFYRQSGRGDGHGSQCKSCVRARRNSTPDFHRRNNFKARYGITLEEYDALVVTQGGKCGACLFASPELVVDHCHTTGKVRGLLCRQCNTGIGLLGDTASRLEQALRYLVATESDNPETPRRITA